MSNNQHVTCTRKIHFCAGHRVMGHENKCATPHGHNYYVHFFAKADALDDIGRVIDFSVIKTTIGEWINEQWDHTFLVWEKDKQTIDALMAMPRNKDPFVCTFNPTAENMALFLLHEICPKQLANSGVTINKVVIYETDNCYATAELSP